MIRSLLWFLRREERPFCGRSEIRRFLAYLIKGHEEPGGRWGNPRLTKPVREGTVDTYFGHLHMFFAWIVDEGGLPDSPLRNLKGRGRSKDQIQPFTDEQVGRLLAAARQTDNARRNEVIVWLLLDSGIRVRTLRSAALRLGLG